jgi:hypothetical protein
MKGYGLRHQIHWLKPLNDTLRRGNEEIEAKQESLAGLFQNARLRCHAERSEASE